MINIITGAFGCGKSTLIRNKITSLLGMGKEVFLIVPEQETVDMECAITDACISMNVPSCNLEVLNFTRLCDRIFRTYGGLCYNYKGSGAKKIIMWRALSNLADTLTSYKNITLSDKNMLSMMLSATDEFARCGVSPDMLLDAAKKLSDTKETLHLSQKISDLAVIYSAYSTLLHCEYDDPSEDQNRLCKILSKNDFFDGKYVFFDSFTSFTAIQLEIIGLIVKQAEECTFSIPLPSENNGGLMYTSLRNTLSQLKKLAGMCGCEINHTSLTTPVRFNNSELPNAGLRLWDFASKEAISDNEPEHIEIVRCGDIFSEAEECMRRIALSVRNGNKYSDSIIAVRDTSEYLGVIDAMAEKYSVPCFISRRNEMMRRPIIRLISSAFGVITSGWRKEDIISYIKTGLAGINSDESDLLDGYTTLWRISGSRWYSDDDWMMNPNGYTDIFSEEDANTLEKLNSLRRTVVSPLLKLSSAFGESCTVKDGCVALFEFLQTLNIRSILENSGSDDASQVWNLLIDLLEQLNTAAASATVNAEAFYRLLAIMLDDADTGRIPAAMDEVVFTDAQMLRSSGKKFVYILGANDGVFPQNVKDNGIFNDAEKVSLESCGIELSPLTDTRSSDELYYFARALTCVSDKATILYRSIGGSSDNEMKPSAAVERICLLFPALKITSLGKISFIDRIVNPSQSIELIPQSKISDPVFSESLREAYRSYDDYSNRIAAIDLPLIESDINVSHETAAMLFGHDIYMSSSRLDSYVSCGFSYYCKYVLKLAEQRSCDFKPLDRGNYIHRLFERLLKMIQKPNLSLNTDISDEDLTKLIDEITEDYIASIFRGKEKRTARITALFERLKRNALLFVKKTLSELKDSAFVPCFFEFPINNSENGIKPLRIPLDDGSGVYITGKVDRVDILPHTVTEDGNNYVRVIDYKTGKKDFSLSNIDNGKDLQMFLYLKAILAGADKKIIEKIGGEEVDNLPAGVLYVPTRLPSVSDSNDKAISSEEDIYKIMKPQGVVVDNDDVMKNSPIYSTPRSKKMNVTTTSIEGLENIMTKINEVVEDIVTDMRDGHAEALPLKAKIKTNDRSECEYCPMKAVCRSAVTERR